MKHQNLFYAGLVTAALIGGWLLASCSKDATVSLQGASTDIKTLMEARKLSEADVMAALKTYTPTGRKDEYIMFASGGHGGQIIVIGLPSMRILKYIGVFTPEPWQGYGYGDQTNDVLAGGSRNGRAITWGDVHHPSLSETNGDYDGQFLFVNDKANPRLAVVNLKDFCTTQIVVNPLVQSEHGAAFCNPNTDYVVETSQYPTPLGGEYAPLEQFNEKYRGAITFWKFDRAKGRVVPEDSWGIELPPYCQDLADFGKVASDGWLFMNSFNTERSYGGNMEGKPSMESGASQNDMDYLHIINWRKAEEVVKAGKFTRINGFRTISLQTAIDEKILFFAPEPKSPHGCDVSPDGESVVVGGKLDTHCTVYSVAQIKALTEKGDFSGRDPYGVPILDFKKAIRGQCQIGLGPLHSVYDDKGFVYTSVFLESCVVKWSLKELNAVDRISCHYNIGHLTAVEGDTCHPGGQFVVGMDKWALDRFNDVGPLLPQNFQLIDIRGSKMELLYDLPIPCGEPHYAQIIKAERLHPIRMYTPAGMDAVTHAPDPFAVKGGQERIERKGNEVHVYMTAIRSHFTPDIVRVKQGDVVWFHITNVEQAHDATHGFTVGSHNIHVSLEPGKHCNIKVVADRVGVFPMYCTEFCSALHLEMAGYFLVEPK